MKVKALTIVLRLWKDIKAVEESRAEAKVDLKKEDYSVTWAEMLIEELKEAMALRVKEVETQAKNSIVWKLVQIIKAGKCLGKISVSKKNRRHVRV